MFDTQIGPTGQFKGYLRPETAQGHFLNFKKLLEHNNDAMPFASASIGKSFRNEISPRQGLLRVREFTMAEIEHYVHPDRKNHARFVEVKDIVLPLYSSAAQLAAEGPTNMSIGAAVAKKIVDNETLGYFIARIYLFVLKLGISPSLVRFRQHLANEMAHYACDCWDLEIKSSYGWIESVGCADRSAFDLTAHSKKSGEKLVAREYLEIPIVSTRLHLEFNKKVFGPAFKQNAKTVTAYFDAWAVEGVHDQTKLAELKAELEKGDVVITAADGNNYTITPKMLTIEMKTEKINGS
jgi:glycyl-tRNA synthetase